METRKSKTAGHLIRNDKINKGGINFINTCGFDSIIACLCTLYRDPLANELNPCEIKHNIDQLVQYLQLKGHDRKAEALKVFILSKMFGEQSTVFKFIDCNNNV